MPVMRNSDQYVNTLNSPVDTGSNAVAELLNSQESHVSWKGGHGAAESAAWGAATGVAQQQLYGPDGQPYSGGQQVGKAATVGAIKGLLGWFLAWVLVIAGLFFVGSLFTGNLIFTVLSILVIVATIVGFVRLVKKG